MLLCVNCFVQNEVRKSSTYTLSAGVYKFQFSDSFSFDKADTTTVTLKLLKRLKQRDNTALFKLFSREMWRKGGFTIYQSV
jgi:hypothetical protein